MARSPGAVAAAETFLREIAWRDFVHHLLFHFPHTLERWMRVSALFPGVAITAA